MMNGIMGLIFLICLVIAMCNQALYGTIGFGFLSVISFMAFYVEAISKQIQNPKPLTDKK
jgi:hypothetical protein